MRVNSKALLPLAAAAVGLVALAGPAQASGQKLSNAEALRRLHAVGISVTSTGHCSNRDNPNSTSLDGVLSGTIDGIIGLRRASGCPIVITGGTEAGHGRPGPGRTHWNGYKLDIDPNACVSNYITRHFRYTGVRGDGARMWTSPHGDVYAREGNHWDIVYP